MFSYNVENPNLTDKKRNILHACMPQTVSRKTKEQEGLIYIDQQILKKVKIRHKNVAIAWIDYIKACDIVP